MAMEASRRGAVDVDMEAAECGRVMQVEEPAGADLADGGIVEAHPNGDDVMGGPGLAAIDAEHQAGSWPPVAARNNAVAHRYEVGRHLADLERDGLAPRFPAIVGKDLKHLRGALAAQERSLFRRG